jgi:hypothetical protein
MTRSRTLRVVPGSAPPSAPPTISLELIEWRAAELIRTTREGHGGGLSLPDFFFNFLSQR